MLFVVVVVVAVVVCFCFFMNQMFHLIEISGISGKNVYLYFPFFDLEMIASQMLENSQRIKQINKK